MGGILIIATTSSVTIFLNAIMSFVILGERFAMFPDGISFFLIGIGGTLAAI